MDPVHREQAEFIRGALFEDMSTSWHDQLADILSFLPFGWHFAEVVYKRRDGESKDPARHSNFSDGKISWRKWAGRAQETLDEWKFDDAGGIQGMWQDPGMAGGGRRFIPIEKALLFRADTAKGNPEGRSILRSAWTSYYRQEHIENVLGIGIERDLSGYPVFQQLKPEPDHGLEVPDIFDPEDTDAKATLDEFKKIGKSLRRDEQECLVLPWWMEFKLQATGGRRQFDLDKVLARYDRLIALTTLTDFIFIGHDAVGSKALVQSRIKMFEMALAGFLKSITDVVNRFAILPLLRLNGMPMDAPPRLAHGPLSQIDLTDLGEYLSKLAGAGQVLFGENSEDLERHLLERGQLPTTSVTQNSGN